MRHPTEWAKHERWRQSSGSLARDLFLDKILSQTFATDRSMEPCGLANGSKHEGYQGNEATRKLRDQPMEHLWRCTGCNGWKRAKMWEWFLIVIVCSSLQPRCVVAVFFSRACKGTLGSFVGAALANASWITKQYLQSEGEQIHTNTKWNSIRRNSDNIWVKGEMQFAFIDRFSDSCRCCAQVVSWLPSLLLWWHARWSKAVLFHKEPCEKKMSENHSRRRHNLRQFKIICEAERPNASDGKIRLRLG